MANLIYRAKLGGALCAFYGIITLASIAQLISNFFGLYSPIFSPLIWTAQDIICCASMCFITFNKSIRPNIIGRIGSGIFAISFGLFAVNVLLSYSDINMFSFAGHYSNVAVGAIELIAAGLLFFSLKIWVAVKISAFIYWIPSLCAAFYITKLRMASELGSDWSFYEKMCDALQICDNIALVLSILTVLVTLVWIVRKPIAPHTKSNVIDVI